MKYTVIEMQNGVVGANVWTFDEINQAEAKYHAVLSVAAVSAVKTHAAAILNETGFLVRSQCYTHDEVISA